MAKYYEVKVNDTVYRTEHNILEVTLPPATIVNIQYRVIDDANGQSTDWINILTNHTVATIDTVQISDASITTAKIQDATITDAKIVNMQAGKITAGTISSRYIYLGDNKMELDGIDGAIRIKDSYGADRVLIGRITKPTSTTATFTRNSVAFAEDGTQVEVNTPRYKAGAILIEEGTTNLIEQYEPGASQDWSKWSHWNVSTYWYSTTQYDDSTWGKVFYGKAKRNASGDTYIYNYSPTITVTAGTTYTFSFYVKTSSNLTLSFMAYFNYGGGIMIATTTKTYTLKANEWTRVEFQLTPSTSRSDAQYGVKFVDIPDGTYFWIAYPQIEAKPYPTSFVNGTRSYEKLALPLSSSMCTPRVGTASIRFYYPNGGITGTHTTRMLLNIGKADTGTDRIALSWNETSKYFSLYISYAGNTGSVDSGTLNPSVGWHTLTGVWKYVGNNKNILKLYLDGTLIASSSSMSDILFFDNWVHNYTYVGNSGTEWTTANTYYDFVAFWNRALSDAEAQSIIDSPLAVPDFTAFYDFNYNLNSETFDYGIKILDGHIDASAIKTGIIDASKVNVTNLNASNITTGTLDASKVNVTNLTASSITSGTLTLKGNGSTGAELRVVNAADTEIIRINAAGIQVKDLSTPQNTIVTINQSGIVVDKGSIVVKDGNGSTIIDSTGILKVKDGVITSASLSSAAVTPNKVGFPMLDNELVINSDFCTYDVNGNIVGSMEGWTSLGGSATVVDVSNSNPPTSKFALQNSNGTLYLKSKSLIPIDRNKTYVVECYARTVSGSSGTFYLGVRLYRADGSEILVGGGAWYYPASAVVPGTNWTYYYGVFGAGTSKPFPNDAVYMTVAAILGYEGDRVMQVQGITIRQVLDSVYIKDASITTAKIQDAAITDAKISSLSANKITTGTLTVGGSSNVTLRIIKPDGTTMAQFDNTGLKIFGGSLQVYSGSTTSSATVINGNSITADYITTGTLSIGGTAGASISLKDASNTEIIKMDQNGIQVNSSSGAPKVQINANGLTINNGSITINAADGSTMISGSQINANYINTGTLKIGGSGSNASISVRSSSDTEIVSITTNGIKVKDTGGTEKVTLDSNGITIRSGSLTIYDSTNTKTLITGDSINAEFIKTGTLLISGTNSSQIKIVSSDSLGAMILGYYDDGTGNLFKGIRISRTDTVPKSIFLGFDQTDKPVLSAQNSDLNISAQSLVINATGTVKTGTINATNELSVIASNQSKPFRATPDTGVEILLGSGSNNNSAFTLSYQSNTNLNWKIDYQPSRSFTRVFDGFSYTIGNSTGIWFNDSNETTFGIIRDTNGTSTQTRLFYVLNKPLDTSLSSLSQYRTIDGRTIIPGTIPLDAMYSYTKATASGSYTDVTSGSSISVSIAFGNVEYYVTALDPYYINQICMFFGGPFEHEVTKVQVYGYSESATNYSQSVASSGSPRTVTLSWTMPSLPNPLTVDERRTTYYYVTWDYPCGQISADTIATRGSVVSDVWDTTTRSVSSYDYRSGYVRVSFSINVGTTYAGRQYKVTLTPSTGTANIDGYSTRILYGTVASNGTISFNSTINVTSSLSSNAQFTVKVEVMNISTYIQPVSLPGYVVFATSGTGAAVDTSGNTPSGYLDGTAGNVYPTTLPGYVQNYFDAAWGSAVANTGIVYVYELDKVFGSAKNVQVFLRFWDDRYAVYSYNGTSWSNVSSSTTYTTDASTVVTVSNCMKVAIAYSNGGGGAGGIEFALRIY